MPPGCGWRIFSGRLASLNTAQRVDEIARSTARFVVNPVRFRAKYERIIDLVERLESAAAVSG